MSRTRVAARFLWRIPPSQRIGRTVTAMGDAVGPYLDQEMDVAGEEVLAWMQANHRWTNRSGEAEANLYVEPIEHGFRMGGRAPHQIFLETMAGGEWGVIRPGMTVAEQASQRAIDRTVERIMGLGR